MAAGGGRAASAFDIAGAGARTVGVLYNRAVRNRIQFDDIRPCIDGGRYAAKGCVDQPIDVAATIFREGHDKVAAMVRYRMVDDDQWNVAMLDAHEQDRFNRVNSEYRLLMRNVCWPQITSVSNTLN